MGKSSSTTQMKSSIRKSNEPHGIWRGIGCLMMIIIPAISIAAAVQTVALILANHLTIIPPSLLGYPQLPALFQKSSGLMIIFGGLTKMQNLYAQIAFSLMYMLIISGLISLAYAIIYSVVGPSRYGPTDAPPEKIRITKKSR
jgi:hypothetical protein